MTDKKETSTQLIVNTAQEIKIMRDKRQTKVNYVRIRKKALKLIKLCGDLRKLCLAEKKAMPTKKRSVPKKEAVSKKILLPVEKVVETEAPVLKKSAARRRR